MIAVDTNVLVYAHREDSPFHESARVAIDSLAVSRTDWTIPWPCVHEFLAIVTHPRIFNPPTPLALAIDQVNAWLESPSLVLLRESPDHWIVLSDLLEGGKIVGPQVHDARIAALCIQHGARELWSADRDFSRTPGLTITNPCINS